MKTIRVKILCSWASSEDVFHQIKKQSQDNNGRWNDIQLTSDDNDIDYYIVINSPINHTTRKMQFHEPQKTIIWNVEHAKAHWRKKYKYDQFRHNKRYLLYLSHEDTLNWGEFHLSLGYNELLTKPIEKNKTLSAVIGPSRHLKLQKKRHDFIKYFSRQDLSFLETNFDHYGWIKRKVFPFSKDTSRHYRGALPKQQKDLGVFPYKYSIAVEAYEEHNYITEKLFDSILAECLTFYYGCPNIASWIDKKAFIQLDINNFEKSYQIIKEAIENDEWGKRIDIIRKEKIKILNEYNFFPKLEKIIVDQS